MLKDDEVIINQLIYDQKTEDFLRMEKPLDFKSEGLTKSVFLIMGTKRKMNL